MRRVRRWPWLAVTLLALIAALGGGDGATLGLWVAQTAPTALGASQSTLGLAVTKDHLDDVATSAADTVQFTIGSGEATTLVDDGPAADGTFAVAVPFDVTLLVSGGYGLDYTIDIASPQPDTVFGLPGAGPVFFPVNDPSACTVAAAASAQTSTAPVPVTGLAGGGNAAQSQVDHWCLVVSVTPPTYGASATADGTNLLDATETSVPGLAADWSSYIVPDPVLEPDLAVTITPVPQPAP